MEEGENTIICGLDLSFTSTGWSVIVMGEQNRILYGEIKTTKKNHPDDIDRCCEIAGQIFDLLTESNPNLIIIEDTFVGLNRSTGKKLIQLGAIVRAMLKTTGYHYIDIAPKTLKKYTTGNGNATKQMMIDEVNNGLGLTIKSDNIADSIALACYGAKEIYSASVIFNELLDD